MDSKTREQRWATQRMRTVWKINDNYRDAGLRVPDDVVWAENILYGPYGNWNLLDIYYPKAEVQVQDDCSEDTLRLINADGVRKNCRITKKLPVIFDIHGGGWQYGDKELYRHYNAALAQNGFAVVGFNYRIAPEDYFPAAFTDVNRAMTWVVENADRYGLDMTRVFVLGDSAGGQMASWYCTLLTNQAFRDVYAEIFPLAGQGETAPFTMAEYARTDTNDPFDPDSCRGIPEKNMKPDEEYTFDVPYDRLTLCACALNCGVYDMVTSVSEKDADGAFNQFLGDLLETRRADVLRLVDSWNYQDAAFPPAYIMSAEYDFLKKMAEPMSNHLTSLGVENELHIYGKPGQEYMAHVFHINQKLDEAHQCNKDEVEFFLRHIR